MTLPEETATIPIVTLTPSAAKAVHDIIVQKDLPGYALRLYISGGGCSGYQYGLALDKTIRPEDTVIEMDNVKLIVDEVSIKYLQGATVDYVDDLANPGFKIINPNPISSCSCGQSADSAGGESANTCEGCG